MDENLNPSEQPGTDSEVIQPSMEDRLASKFGFDTQNNEGTVEVETPDAQAEGAEQPAQADSDEVELEFNGKTYRVPKELQEARLRHEDYTRKTQDIAERARVIDAQARMVQEQQQFQAAHATELQTLHGLQQQIAEYSRVDMSQLQTEQLLKLKMHLDTLKEHERNLVGTITQKAQEFQGKVQKSLAELQQQGEQTLRKSIPKWGPETARELSEYGVTQGYQQHELAQLYDPRHVQTLWKAQQWDKLQASKPSIEQRANAASPVVKPGASNPEMNKRMEKVRFAKQMQTAKTPSQRNGLILSRLEKLV